MEDISNLFKKIEEIGGISKVILHHIGIPNFSFEDSALKLSNYGWYIPEEFQLKQINELVSLFDSNQKEADDFMIDFFRKNIKSIEKKLIRKHIERKEIIKEAFKGHYGKMFCSSTILFISISDGLSECKIFKDTKNFNKKIDMTKNPKIIKILSAESPLNVDTRKEKNTSFFSELNRHNVIHGMKYDYGNEINSLKSLSLLCFISDWYNRYDDRNTATSSC
jgi:hypothetical protein